MSKKHTYDYIKNFIEQTGYCLLSTSYKNNRTKLLLKCPIGHEYKVTFGNFMAGWRCPICNGNKKLDYGYVKTFIESEGHKLLSDSYTNNRTKLIVKCPNNHTYNIRFNNFKNGQRCSICHGNKKLNYDYVKNFIEQNGYSLLSTSYKNVATKLTIKCPNNHTYKATFNVFKNGRRCPSCWFENKSSNQENDLAEFIISMGIPVIRNDRTKIINPLTNNNLELDIFIPSLNKAIEYNGTYWHKKTIQQKRDIIKLNQCKKLNIDLLIINEYNWLNFKKMEMDKIKMWLHDVSYYK